MFANTCIHSEDDLLDTGFYLTDPYGQNEDSSFFAFLDSVII